MELVKCSDFMIIWANASAAALCKDTRTARVMNFIIIVETDNVSLTK